LPLARQIAYSSCRKYKNHIGANRCLISNQKKVIPIVI
jgi:hypothetical protein